VGEARFPPLGGNTVEGEPNWEVLFDCTSLEPPVPGTVPRIQTLFWNVEILYSQHSLFGYCREEVWFPCPHLSPGVPEELEERRWNLRITDLQILPETRETAQGPQLTGKFSVSFVVVVDELVKRNPTRVSLIKSQERFELTGISLHAFQALSRDLANLQFAIHSDHPLPLTRQELPGEVGQESNLPGNSSGEWRWVKISSFSNGGFPSLARGENPKEQDTQETVFLWVSSRG
jgi:hypothetical protein